MKFFNKSTEKVNNEFEKSLPEQDTSFDEKFKKMKSEIMDINEFKEKVLFFLWKEDLKGLKELCENQFIVTPIFTEKAIKEIAPNNNGNDFLFYIAKKIIEINPQLVGHLSTWLKDKILLVNNPNGGKEILEKYVVIESHPDEFLSKLKLISETPTFLGLDNLVQYNPNNVYIFIKQWLSSKKGSIDTNSRSFICICEMAKFYRNYHHKEDLLNQIENTAGTLHFFKENPDIGSIVIIEGTTKLHEFDANSKTAKGLLFSGDIAGAIKVYENLIPKMDTIYASSYPMSPCEYENSLLFYGVLLSLMNKTSEAQVLFMKCAKKRYHFGELLLFSSDLIKENSEIIYEALGKVSPESVKELNFDFFFELVTGHSYFKVNKMFDEFYG